MRVLLDSNVIVYATGREHPYREPCRTILAAGGDGRLALEASALAVQEVAHLRLRRDVDPLVVAREVQALVRLCRIWSLDGDALLDTAGLLSGQHDLAMADAVHAATALRSGLGAIVSADQVFDALDGVRRIDPADLADQLGP